MGWDAFGLPADQYAMKTGTHPSKTTRENVKNLKRQIMQDNASQNTLQYKNVSMQYWMMILMRCKRNEQL